MATPGMTTLKSSTHMKVAIGMSHRTSVWCLQVGLEHIVYSFGLGANDLRLQSQMLKYTLPFTVFGRS